MVILPVSDEEDMEKEFIFKSHFVETFNFYERFEIFLQLLFILTLMKSFLSSLLRSQ